VLRGAWEGKRAGEWGGEVKGKGTGGGEWWVEIGGSYPCLWAGT